MRSYRNNMLYRTILHEEGKTTSGIFYRRTVWSGSDQIRPTLLMVMGYGGSLCIWPETLVNKLAEKYDVVTYDNRGTGLSFLPENETDYSTKSMADDINEVVKALALKQIHLMGYSM